MEPGKEIEVQGVLHDKETGEVVKVDGKEITATRKIYSNEKQMELTQVTFKFDVIDLWQERLLLLMKKHMMLKQNL